MNYLRTIFLLPLIPGLFLIFLSARTTNAQPNEKANVQAPVAGNVPPAAPQSTSTTFQDPSGFSFTYSSFWFSITDEAKKELIDSLPDEMKKLRESARNGTDKVKCMLFRRENPDAGDNISLASQDKELPVRTLPPEAEKQKLIQQIQANGLNVRKIDFTTSSRGTGNYPVIIGDMESQLPGVNEKIRQRQVFFAGGGKTFVFTLSGDAESWDTILPEFEKLLTTVHVPASQASALNSDKLLKFIRPLFTLFVIAFFLKVLIFRNKDAINPKSENGN